MRFAKDFRQIGWMALEGNYWIAVLVTLVAGALGGKSFTGGLEVSLKHSLNGGSGAPPGELPAIPLGQLLQRPEILALLTILSVWLICASLFSLARFLLGGAIQIGLCRYNLGITDGKKERFSTLFSGFSIFGKALGLRCWSQLFILLWSLLLVVPGIVAAYRYAMAPFIMAEEPSIGVRQAVTISKRMMKGNKWRLFCLNLSFIGWHLLALLTAGMGEVFLLPYVNAARTAFYLEVSGQNYRLAGYRLPTPQSRPGA